MAWNYTKMSNKAEILEVEDRNELPAGLWLPVREAAQALGVTTMTVRYRWMKGQYRAAKVGNGELLVCVKGSEKNLQFENESVKLEGT